MCVCIYTHMMNILNILKFPEKSCLFYTSFSTGNTVKILFSFNQVSFIKVNHRGSKLYIHTLTHKHTCAYIYIHTYMKYIYILYK